MYSSTFIFAKGEWNEEFLTLDAAIAQVAKSKQGNWLAGYQVVISQVLRTYGDTKLTGKLPMAGATRAFAHGGPSA